MGALPRAPLGARARHAQVRVGGEEKRLWARSLPPRFRRGPVGTRVTTVVSGASAL